MPLLPKKERSSTDDKLSVEQGGDLPDLLPENQRQEVGVSSDPDIPDVGTTGEAFELGKDEGKQLPKLRDLPLETATGVEKKDGYLSSIRSYETFDFMTAIHLLKYSRKKVARMGWNGAMYGDLKMYVEAQYPDEHSANTNPYLYMVVYEARTPWHPSNIDIFADDWIQVE